MFNKSDFLKFCCKATIFFFLWSSLAQVTSSFAQQPTPPPGTSVPPSAALLSGTFPFLTEITAVPGDTFVDLKWTPYWKEEVRARPGEARKLLEERGEEAITLKEKQMMQVLGVEKVPKLKPEEKAKLKTEEVGKAREQIPEEREIAGYIIHFGKDPKNYTSKIDVGLTNNFRVRGLTNYSTYFFAIQAYNKARELSLPSKEISVMPKEEKDLLSPLEKSFLEEKIPQAVSREIKQFGYDFFRSKTSSFAPVADVPVGPDYVIGPGDSFTLTLWGRIGGSYPVEVDRNGEISIPKVGVLKV